MKNLNQKQLFLFWIVLTFFDFTSVVAQEVAVENLKIQLLKSKEDTNKLNLFNQLVEAIDEDSIWMPYNEQMGKLAQFLMRNKETAIQLAAKKRYATYLFNSGFFYYNKSNYSMSLEYYYSSLKIFESLNDKPKIADLENEIGNVYSGINDPVHEMEHYKKSIAIFSQLKDSASILLPLNGLGVVYNNANDFENALKCYQTCLIISNTSGDNRAVAIALNSIASVFDRQGETDSALKNYNEAYRIFKELNDKDGLYASQISIGNIFLKQNKFKESEKLFLASLQIANESSNPQKLIGITKYLSKYYAVTNNYKEAYSMQLLNAKLTDSLRNDKNRLAILNLQANYEFDKKAAAIKAEQDKKEALAQQEISKQKVIRNAVAGGAGVMLISGFFSFVFYRRRRDAEMQHKIMVQRMQAINAQMNPHFIFNCMHSVQSFISNKDFVNADNCLMRFAKLIRKVLDNSTQASVSLEDELITLNDYVELEKMRLEFPLEFDVSMDANINADDIFIPPMLLQPIIENAIIHGLKPKNADGRISISIKQFENNLMIVVTDNGVGRTEKPERSDSRKSYGIPLTKERLQYLSGNSKAKSFYEVEDVYNSQNVIAGTKVSLAIPIV